MRAELSRAPARPWLRGFVSRLLLMGLGVIVALVLTEGMARLLVPMPGHARFEPDPDVGFRHAASQRVWLTNAAREFGVWFTTNAHGDPDRERTLAKPSDTYRIAVLGDSMVEAAQVQPNERFTALLEQQLTDWAQAALGNPRQVEVMNFGTASYGTAQEWQYYESHVRSFAPDLVVLVVFPGNDVQNNSYALEVEHAGRPEIMPFYSLNAAGALVLKDGNFVENAQARYDAALDTSVRRDGWTDFLSERLTLVALVRQAYAGFRAGGDTGYSPEAQRQLALWAELYDPARQAASPEWQQAWQVTSALLDALQTAAAQDGAQLHTVIVPGGWEVDPASRVTFPVDPDGDLDWALPNRMTASLLDEAGRPYTNLLPALATGYASGDEQLHFPLDGHLTPAGHALVAAELLPVLQRYIAPND